jgi:hypothetical protein
LCHADHFDAVAADLERDERVGAGPFIDASSEVPVMSSLHHHLTSVNDQITDLTQQVRLPLSPCARRAGVKKLPDHLLQARERAGEPLWNREAGSRPEEIPA